MKVLALVLLLTAVAMVSAQWGGYPYTYGGYGGYGYGSPVSTYSSGYHYPAYTSAYSGYGGYYPGSYYSQYYKK